MIYPLLSEYIDAISSAEDNFEELNHLRPVLGADGKPYMSSGNFAVVFKMQDPQGKLFAVKCFTKEQKGREEAYTQIAQELQYVESPFLTSIRYLNKELFVDTQQSDTTEFPVVLMDWVDGIPLDAYAKANHHNANALNMLSYKFSQMAMWLLSQPFAHGDLKPDNILVHSDGSLVLVDYDGMYVPAMKGQKARELGSPDYCHPLRTEKDFNQNIDDFALSTIALSLKAISLQPDLLDDATEKDVLLLTQQDFRDLSSSETFAQLSKLCYNAELSRLLGCFLVAHSTQNVSALDLRLFAPGKPTAKQIVKQKTIKPRISNFYQMVKVQGGSFNMGSNDADSDEDEQPIHKVTLDSFLIGKYQVTQEQWQKVMGNNPSYFKGDLSLPVESVTWYDCVAFCNALSKKEGLQECYIINGNNVTLVPTAKGYRLPTEAEWEFAARGGVQSKGYKYSGSNNLDEVAWFDKNSGNKTHIVGQKKANELGIFDMSGNVWEWCWDWFDSDYYAYSPNKNPLGPTSGSNRVLRGGSDYNLDWGCRLAGRGRYFPVFRNYDIVLRLLRQP